MLFLPFAVRVRHPSFALRQNIYSRKRLLKMCYSYFILLWCKPLIKFNLSIKQESDCIACMRMTCETFMMYVRTEELSVVFRVHIRTDAPFCVQSNGVWQTLFDLQSSNTDNDFLHTYIYSHVMNQWCIFYGLLLNRARAHIFTPKDGNYSLKSKTVRQLRHIHRLRLTFPISRLKRQSLNVTVFHRRYINILFYSTQQSSAMNIAIWFYNRK